MTAYSFRAIALCASWIALIPLSAQSSPPGAAQYAVELREAAIAVDSAGTVAGELARTYGGTLPEQRTEDGFVINMTPERARLLASDPRVKSLVPNGTPLPPMEIGPFKYDAAGNVIHIGADRYTYDRMSRLVSGTAVTTQNSDTQQFTYDGFGNLKKILVPSKSTLYIDVDSSNNRLQPNAGPETGTNVTHTWAGGANGGYDTAGNQTGVNGGQYIYTYDSFNMLARLSGPRTELYLYDANDERVATVYYTNSLNAAWRYTLRDVNANVLREVTDTISGGAHSWRWAKDYVHRGGPLLAAVAPLSGGGEQRTHFHLDHLGTPVLITDDNGEVLATHKYWPYGTEAPGSDTDGERMKFTGHERDVYGSDVNVLDYMHARYYRSVEGRFFSVDSHSATPGELQSWNRYAYTRNNPIRYIDPNGEKEFEFKIRHFIPASTVQLPHGRNLGDGRTFSLRKDASVRTERTIRVETDPAKNPKGVVTFDPPRIGRSENFTLDLSGRGKGDSMTVESFRVKNWGVMITATQNEPEPWPVSTGLPQLAIFITGRGGIRSTVNILVLDDGSMIDVSGVRSAFPAMEINASTGNMTFAIYRGNESETPGGMGIFKTVHIYRKCDEENGTYKCHDD